MIKLNVAVGFVEVYQGSSQQGRTQLGLRSQADKAHRLLIGKHEQGQCCQTAQFQ